MSWRACLELHYSLESARTVARYRHDGPLRVLRSLYPEGDTVCHNVLVHPPGGLVGGDTVETQVSVAPGSTARWASRPVSACTPGWRLAHG